MCPRARVCPNARAPPRLAYEGDHLLHIGDEEGGEGGEAHDQRARERPEAARCQRCEDGALEQLEDGRDLDGIGEPKDGRKHDASPCAKERRREVINDHGGNVIAPRDVTDGGDGGVDEDSDGVRVREHAEERLHVGHMAH